MGLRVLLRANKIGGAQVRAATLAFITLNFIDHSASLFRRRNEKRGIPRTAWTWYPSHGWSWWARGNIKRPKKSFFLETNNRGDLRGWWLLPTNRDRLYMSQRSIDKNRESFRGEKAQHTIMEPIMFMLGWSAEEIEPETGFEKLKMRNNARTRWRSAAENRTLCNWVKPLKIRPTFDSLPTINRNFNFVNDFWFIVHVKQAKRWNGGWRVRNQLEFDKSRAGLAP